MQELGNYIPIALFAVFPKITEIIMKLRPLHFLNRTTFFSSQQYGFTEGKDTEDAESDFLAGVCTALNSTENVAGLFIDFSKASDLVDHEVLLHEIERSGSRGVTQDWFDSVFKGFQ